MKGRQNFIQNFCFQKLLDIGDIVGVKGEALLQR